MTFLAIAEVMAAVAAFTMLGALSFRMGNAKEEHKTNCLHKAAYIMYEN